MSKKFVITANMNNGDAWETVRNTKSGMEEVVANILADKDIVRFTVEELNIKLN